MKSLVIAIILFLISVNNSFTIANDQILSSKSVMEKVNIGLNGPVKKVIESPDDDNFIKRYYFNSNGCLYQKEWYAESSFRTTTITDTYDNKERIIKNKWDLRGTEPGATMAFYSVYSYDDVKRTYLSTRTENGKTEITSTGILDNYGNVIEKLGYSFGGRPTTKTVREFNDFGQEIKSTVYDIEGPVWSIVEKTYNPLGRQLSSLAYKRQSNSSLELASKEENFYKDNRLDKTVYNDLLKKESKITTYEYLNEDKYHNWTKMKMTITAGTGTIVFDITRQIEYY